MNAALFFYRKSCVQYTFRLALAGTWNDTSFGGGTLRCQDTQFNREYFTNSEAYE